MTTKEQERKALAKIMKIVEELGENSYIGTAFEGCFEIAESNIEYDFADSMKHRAESAERDAKKIGDLYTKASKELGEKNEFIEKLKKEQDREMNRIGDLNKQLQETCDSSIANWNQARELEKTLEAKEMEIMKLKAKLYDLMTAA